MSGTTQVSQYQKGKTNLDFTGARDSEWQWHQLGHMQVCTLLQTDNHASTSSTQIFYRPNALPAAQPTASKHGAKVSSASCKCRRVYLLWPALFELVIEATTPHLTQTVISLGLGGERAIQFVQHQTETVHVRLNTHARTHAYV